MKIRERLSQLGLEIPPAQIVPAGMQLTYRRLVRDGDIVWIAGHGPTLGEGWGSPLGKVGRDLSVEQGAMAAQLTALNVLGTIERDLGPLENVRTWLKVVGYVNCDPDFAEHAQVVNGFSDLLLELYGIDRLAARSSVGVPSLPFGMPVEVDAVLAWNDDGT